MSNTNFQIINQAVLQTLPPQQLIINTRSQLEPFFQASKSPLLLSEPLVRIYNIILIISQPFQQLLVIMKENPSEVILTPKDSTPDDEFYPNYNTNHCWFNRFFFFSHLFSSVQKTRQILLRQIQDGEEQSLEIQDVHKISPDDDCASLSKKLVQNIESQINFESQMNDFSMFLVTLLTFKWEIFRVWIFYMLEMIFRLTASVFIQQLIESVINQNSSQAYWNAGILVVLLFFVGIFKHNAFYESALLNSRVKNAFIYTIYEKVTGLSQFMIRNADMGKVINMLASDFNAMEIKMTFVFIMMTMPFAIIGISVILVFRLGWWGLLCVAIPLALLPLQGIAGKRNSEVLTQVNEFKDKRIKTTTQVIEGIRFVKLYAWQIAFNKMIGVLRESEITKYIKGCFYQSFERAVSNTSSNWAILITLIIIFFTHDQGFLNAAKIFSTTEVMGVFKMTIFLGAGGISFLFELQVIFKRFMDIYLIKNFNMIRIDETTKKPSEEQKKPFKANEDIENQKQDDSKKESRMELVVERVVEEDCGEEGKKGRIQLVDFNAYWETEKFTSPGIKNANLKIQKGQFIGVTGKVGSGKSGLLSCFLKEPPFYSGEINIHGTIAYVEQEPYIFAGTVRQNITFGKPYNEDIYDEVIKNACLESDFTLFPQGDMTIVGQRGITVSGGQKARLSLARALYSNADIYLLDDPISAVDAKVARLLYQNCIMGMLKGKTVVLVTHQVHYLAECDKLIIMDDGSISHFGSPDQLQEQICKLTISQSQSKQKKQQNSLFKTPQKQNQCMKKQEAQQNIIVPSTFKQPAVEVSLKSYFRYIFYNRKFFLITLTLSLFILAEGINTSFFRILSKYNQMQSGEYGIAPKMYWMALGLLQFGYWAVMVSKYFCINYLCLKSNESLHNNMLMSLLRSPTSYFDKVQTGHLINRFSNDLSLMDTTLAYTLIDNVQGPILSIILLVNLFEIMPIFTIPGVINIVLLVIWFLYCKRSIVQSRLLDLKMKSPVFNNIKAMTGGIVQIKIYDMKEEMVKKMKKAINNSMRANNSHIFASRIFGFYISHISMVVAAIGIFIGIKTAADSGIYGVSIVFILQLVDFLQWLFRQMITIESSMVSVERSFEIAHLPDEGEFRTKYDEDIGFKEEIEAEKKQEPIVPHTNWPMESTIAFKNFTMKYREDLPPVIKNLDFVINEGQKVGIVGRTGAGKSSIIQAIFRMVEGQQGSMMSIGGCDARQMGLHSLRKNLSIIPQTPFLFKGTIKQNIDPFNQVSEDKIWRVLEQSDLRRYIETLPNKLNTEISSTSEVFSVGQRQLICLARAILRSSKILLLDQATSNCDMRTDDYIQQTLKTSFAQQTIITIAHRLNTIADYDKVIVMDKGEIVEMGVPFQLLANFPTDKGVTRGGLFAEMVLSTGQNAHNIFSLSKSKYQKSQLDTNSSIEDIELY